MSGLHLVRIALDRPALMAFAVARHRSDDDLGYALHLALRLRFGDAAPQPFRLEEPPGRAPFLIGYTANGVALNAAHALPPVDAALEAIFPSAPECRPMPELWQPGARFRFKVRVRPVVRYGTRIRAERARSTTALLPKAGEVDAFVAACSKADPSTPLDRKTVYRDWLKRRFSPAALLEDARIERMQRVRTRRSRHDGNGTRLTESYEVVFVGTLEVADPGRFADLLARGVGRHGAFGFGMLTLAPPGPQSVVKAG
ncbi:CRISPR system Cascade subunit CasE [Sphingobium fontiphilum]|uniref:CRISPR system Cascade subunit CasE n=1 Tax=Sphingobium fontiphilum TaxID=944425 RepID=A0A7W6DH88_9SPHN|nr:type I-E CRISPR-associated protein Cas6/Cse3/CasE [Sphingobium fontiphilum]MBB3982554.1 CRISPR system Cascade subunit CasE [Sphingobium fontiphilum]